MTVLAFAVAVALAVHPAEELRQCLLPNRAEALDPLLWLETKYLLGGEPHRRAIACLDRFLDGHDAIADPMERAMLQRDLWAVFDWAAMPHEGTSSAPRLALASRIARVMRRIALTDDEIRRLPDSILPSNLFDENGPWVCLSAHDAEPTVTSHFTGRSRFFVFLRLPGGRAATLDYVRLLRASHEPPLLEDDRYLNLRLPQFPAGTAVALVRQLMLVDRDGEIVAAPVTESVQLRVYRKVTPGNRYPNHFNGPSAHDQDFQEFRLSRRTMRLVAVTPDEVEYPVLFSFGIDPFESPSNPMVRRGAILETCRACHSDSGIHAVQSRLRWIRGDDASFDHAVEWETAKTIEKKRRERDFALLRREWR